MHLDASIVEHISTFSSRDFHERMAAAAPPLTSGVLLCKITIAPASDHGVFLPYHVELRWRDTQRTTSTAAEDDEESTANEDTGASDTSQPGTLELTFTRDEGGEHNPVAPIKDRQVQHTQDRAHRDSEVGVVHHCPEIQLGRGTAALEPGAWIHCASANH